MAIQHILSTYENFKAASLTNRFFKHTEVMDLLAKLPSTFKIDELGKSVENRAIKLITCGKGPTKIMLWSQMHGDEATGTMAIFDLINYLHTDAEQVKLIAQACTLFIIPMVNPDGAERFTRRNAQQIDINRDFLAGTSTEARILKQCRTTLNPHYGFNLHDQHTLWSVSGSLKPATLSFLAPAMDEALTVNETRKKAMLVIAAMFNDLNPLLPQQIGLFDDEFEPRAFGDNFQLAGTSTILIEAGGFKADDEKQEIRKYYFAAMLSGIWSIATQSYLTQNLANYFVIPKNKKQLFHILVKNATLNQAPFSIGINYEETPTADGLATFKTYTIADLGDLSTYAAYQTIDAVDLQIQGELIFNKPANFKLLKNNSTVLAFQNGKLI